MFKTLIANNLEICELFKLKYLLLFYVIKYDKIILNAN